MNYFLSNNSCIIQIVIDHLEFGGCQFTLICIMVILLKKKKRARKKQQQQQQKQKDEEQKIIIICYVPQARWCWNLNEYCFKIFCFGVISSLSTLSIKSVPSSSFVIRSFFCNSLQTEIFKEIFMSLMLSDWTRMSAPWIWITIDLRTTSHTLSVDLKYSSILWFYFEGKFSPDLWFPKLLNLVSRRTIWGLTDLED